MEEFILESSVETEKFGFDFAQKLHPLDVVFLIGDLGSGKTTFVKGLAKGLGIESRVISPTFVIVRSHTSSQDRKITTLYHLDLYRLGSEAEVKNIDLTDYLSDATGVVVIEWPQVGQNIVDKKVWYIKFQVLEDNTRKVTIKHE